MAREAVKVELDGSHGYIRRYTVADGVGISKGALLKFSDPRTAAIADSTTGGGLCAGIASEEKVASDGQTSIGAWTAGVFDLYASGAIAVGVPVSFVTGNYVKTAVSLASGAIIAGYALEAASDGEQINVRLML